MTRATWIRLFVVVLLCVWFAGVYFYARPQASGVSEMPCALAQKQCVFRWENRVPAVFKIRGTPSPLTPFEVEIEGVESPSLSISFAMAGMEMGINRFELRPTAPGRWSGRVVLPVCTQNRHDWRVTLANKQHSVVLITSLSAGASS